MTTLPMMGYVELALNGLCVPVARSGVDPEQFFVALFFLEPGWDFLFNGSTAPTLTAYPHTAQRRKGRTRLRACWSSPLMGELLKLGSLLPLGPTGLALRAAGLR